MYLQDLTLFASYFDFNFSAQNKMKGESNSMGESYSYEASGAIIIFINSHLLLKSKTFAYDETEKYF